MLKIFLSSTFRDLKDIRSEILKKLDSVFEGVGMEKFRPDGETSHKNCIDDLKESDIVVFLISPYYGSLIEVCELKDNCKVDDCPMKISYTHCEYKTTLAEGIPHQTYKVLEGWDAPDVQKDPLKMSNILIYIKLYCELLILMEISQIFKKIIKYFFVILYIINEIQQEV